MPDSAALTYKLETEQVLFTLSPATNAWSLKDKNSAVNWGNSGLDTPWVALHHTQGGKNSATPLVLNTVEVLSPTGPAAPQGMTDDKLRCRFSSIDGLDAGLALVFRLHGHVLQVYAIPDSAVYGAVELFTSGLEVNASEDGEVLLPIRMGLLLQVGGAVVPFIVLFVVFFVPLLQALKKRFTFPPTGYVELRQGDPGPLPWLVLGSLALGLVTLVVVLIAVGAIADPARWYRWMPIFFGIWWAGIFVGLGLSVRLVRYYVVAAVALVAGPTSALLALAGKLANIGLFISAVGAVTLVWGLLAFVRFVRHYPRLAEEGVDVTH